MNKRIIALLLALVLTVSCLPPVALAEGTQPTEATTSEQTQVALPEKVEEETAPALSAAHGAHTCESCSGEEWLPWESETDLPNSGHYYLTKNVTLDTSNSSLANGKAISGNTTLNLCLNGCTITSASRVYRVAKSAKLTISDCTGKGILYGGKSIGGVVGVFNDDNTTGSQVSIHNVTLDGSKVSAAPAYGGAVLVNAPGASLNLKGVTIRNFSVSGASGEYAGGAAVYMRSVSGTSSLSMENCTVTGCSDGSTSDSGAVRCYQATTATFTNCVFQNNTNSGTGASAIMLRGTAATMSGCTVTGNSSTKSNWVGAVYVNPSAPLTLTGKNVIKNNTAGGVTQTNLVLNEVSVSQFLSFNNASADSELYITAERDAADPNALIKLTAGNPIAFTYENSGKQYYYNVAQSNFQVQDHIHTEGYADAPANAIWQPWTSTNSLPTSGYYYLTENVTLTSAKALNTNGAQLTLCLNGRTITAPAAGRVFRVSNGHDLTVCDHTKSGTLYAGSANGGAIALVTDSGDAGYCDLKVFDITIEGTAGNTPKQGGGITCTNPHNSATLKNVTFKNLTTVAGADQNSTGGSAIFFYSANTDTGLTVEGCTFTGCADNGNDMCGTVRVRQAAFVTLKNCVFQNNAAAGVGASAIILSGAKNAKMEGCTVTGNTSTGATDWAGAVYVFASSDLTLSGKNIIENNTIQNGSVAANLVLVENASGTTPVFLHFNNTDASVTANISARRGTADPNALINVTGGSDVFSINYGGKVYYFNADQNKFVLTHMHTDGYAGVAGSVAWKPWTSTTTLPTSGYWYLTEDVTLNSRYAEIKNDDVFLCLNGKTVTARAAGSDGNTNVYRLTGSGDLTICDCCANAGTVTGASMGALFTMATATGNISIYDGIFTGNTTNDSGAVLVMQNTTQLFIYGGEFKDNTATNHGGVMFIGSKATATIKGGTFTGNHAPKDGGAIVNQGTLNLEGGKFTGNTAGTNGGAIHTSGTTNISGTPEITGNTPSNLYLTTGKSITLGAMGSGTAKIGISVAANTLPRTLSNDMGSTDCSAYFFSDNAGSEIVNQDNKLYIRNLHKHTDGYAGVAGSVAWKPWTSTTTLPTSGYWYLTEDVTLNSRYAEIKNDDVFLCLNGKTVTARAAGSDGNTNVYRLTGSGDLTICDCCTNAGTVTGATMGALFTMATATGNISIYDGIFTGNTTNDSGAVAVMQNTTHLFIYGGEFKNNTATNNAGAVYVSGTATATISGGKFTGNTAPKNGGAIYVLGKLNLQGGVFTGNRAGSVAGNNGGGIFFGGTQLNISGTPEITGNNVGSATQNLYLSTGKSITLGAMGTGTAKVGISVATNTLPRTLSGDMGSTDCSAYFFSDNADYEIVNKGNQLHMKAIFTHTHADGYAGVPADVEWMPWTSTNSLPTEAGHWVLTKDVTLNTRYAEIKNNDVVICLNGKTVTARAAGTDGNTNIFRLTGSGNLTICDCCAKTEDGVYTAGKLTGASMGAIFTMVTATGTVNIYDGIFADNTTNDSGAVAVMQNTCKLNIYGGEFKNNTATNNGGAIYIGTNAIVTIKGGTFTGNHAPKDGGVIVNAGTLNLQGGKFTGNTAGTNGGAIHTSGTTNISGNPEITGNTANDAANNLYLTTGKTITLGDLAEDTAKIGISVSFSSIPRFLSEDMGDKDVSAYFFSDDPYREITAKDNKLYISHGSNHKHCACAGIGGSVCGHDKEAWGAWVSTTTLPTSGYWYLTEDVTVASTDGVTVSGDLYLCLNGHTIDGAGHVVMKIRNDEHDVVISDCQNSGAITGGSAQNYGAIYLEKGSFTMFGGKLTNNHNTQTTAGGWSGGAIQARGKLTLVGVELSGNTSTTEGGAICVRENGTAYLENCIIKDNSAKNGGAIYLAGTANELTIKNCTIENNSATVNGGAISANGGKVTIESGKIQGNSAASHGGAFYQAGGTLEILGGEIAKNSATVQGGAIFATEVVVNDTKQPSTINICGGKITANTAPDGAAMATIRSTQINMTGGRISENIASNAAGGVLLQTGSNMIISGEDTMIILNEATNYAGGVYISTNSSLTMDGGKISGNKSGLNGGGIFMLGSTLTINDGHVYNNTSAGGAGIFAKASGENGSTIIMNGGNVSTNAATSDGGGISIRDKNTTLTINSGSIQKNTAPSGGAILAIVRSKVNIHGGLITKNESTSSGGAIFMSFSTTLAMDGGKITENTAGANGGGIYLLGAICDVSGGEIIKNTATVQGGGIFATYKEVDQNTVYYSKINISSGKIDANYAPDGGGIGTARYTQIEMTGGHLWGNEANNGAGILLQSGSNMTLSGEGLIAKNIAALSGGGIYVSSNSTLTMNEGGKITENTAGANGGGVMLLGTTFTMNDGTLYGNTANCGGGLYARSGSRTDENGKSVTDVGAHFICKGGNVSTNSADSKGSGGGAVTLYGTNTVFTLDGGYMQKNTAPNGGAVLAMVKSLVEVKSGTLYNNSAERSGGAIYVSTDCSMVMEGGKITTNSAKTAGGAIYLLSSELTMKDGSIQYNTTDNYGGGINGEGSVMNLKGGQILGNEAKKQGGGIYGKYRTQKDKADVYTEINLNGVQVIKNRAKDGAGIATIRYTKVKMTGGSVSSNVAEMSAGGILLQTSSSMSLSGGSVSSNIAQKGSAGGVYASTRCSFNMTGGTISNNKAKATAGGVYLMYAPGNFTGGKIQGNKAETEAGGIYVRGSKATLDGTDILDNEAKNGGGISTVRYPNEKEGIDAQPELIIKSGRIAGNKATNGGAMILQSQTDTKMLGGSIENNYAKSYGGAVYVSQNHTFNVTGGKITGNTSDGWGGGIYHLRGSIGHYEGFELSYNKAKSIGGAIIINGTEAQPSSVTMKNVQVIGNEAREGAGVRTQDRFQSFQAEGCTFKDNKATNYAGGLMIFFGLENVIVKNCLFENNVAETGQGGGVYIMSALVNCEMVGCTFKGNTAGTEGGAMWTQGGLLVKDCTFDDNHAELEGGAIATDVFANTRVRHPVLYLEGCKITNNTSGTNGGGIYADTASYINISDTEISGNTSKAEGGALWIVDDSKLHNVTITGNRSGGEGYALYYHASEYDGLSYIRGSHRIGGEMIVKDNEGGDMYMGEQTGIAVSDAGLTGDTYMRIRLHSGYLTQLLRGAYNYEGGDTLYTVTPGNRSLTDPEVFAEGQANTGDDANIISITPAVWVGGGALIVALIAIAAIVLILNKKKKAAAGK